MMFFSRKYASVPNYSALRIDIHSHLLPGIDDGSPDLDTSLDLIRSMQEMGFVELITTPHIMGDMYPNTPTIIEERLTYLQQGLIEQSVNIPLRAAAEYFFDDQMQDRIRSHAAYLSLPGKKVLCEFSMLTPTFGVKEMIFDMHMQGYQVIIAHPERYIYLTSNKDFYEELRDMGCLFQLNLLSLGAYYSKAVQSLAQHLIKGGFYDYAATDLHNHRHLEELRDSRIGEGLKKLMDLCPIRNAELCLDP